MIKLLSFTLKNSVHVNFVARTPQHPLLLARSALPAAYSTVVQYARLEARTDDGRCLSIDDRAAGRFGFGGPFKFERAAAARQIEGARQKNNRAVRIEQPRQAGCRSKSAQFEKKPWMIEIY